MKHFCGISPKRTVAVIALLLLAALNTSAADRPNIVIIYIDNVGYGDLACYGNPVIQTPRMDRLACEGTRLTAFYIATSTCSASRAALLTGRYPERNGLTHQLSPEENIRGIGLSHDETIIPQYLKQANYATACFGKWNIGFAPGSRPTDRGFDEFFGNISGNCDYYTHRYNDRNDLYRGTEPVQAEGYSTDLTADAACNFIRRCAETDQPFFAYIPFNAAHVPNPKNKRPGEDTFWQAPAEFFRQYGYDPEDRDPSHGYHAVMTALDAGIGCVIDQVDTLGLRDNTLLIVASDNGGRRRDLEVATNAPFRGVRTEVYEGGIRTPCIIRWPGRIPPSSVCREPLTNMDLFALSLGVAGVPLPTDRVIDARDPLPTLTGHASSPHDYLFFQFRKFSGMRHGQWKIVRPNPAAPFELYDLSNDHTETTNLADEKPQLVQDLSAAFESWLQTTKE